MTSRTLTGALIAGLVAGLLAAMLNLWALKPLIQLAETYEGAALHVHDDGTAHAHTHPAMPEGVTRSLGTMAMTLVAYAGFGLLLGAGMAAAARLGHAPSAHAGMLWGLGGFAAIHFAPAVGLPPDLPGTASAALAARQEWWVLCAASTGTGLLAMAFGRQAGALAIGGALVLLPHLLGAPQPPSLDGLVPPGLASAFATRSLGVAVVSWVMLGTLTGALAQRAPARAPA